MEDNRKNLLVTLADRNFVDQAKQLFSSVYFNSGWAGDYLLLSQGIPDNELVWFKDKGILVYDCAPLSDKLVGNYRHPATVLSKFYLFKEYFKNWRKIIFLDADVIVRGLLADLENLNGFNAVSAVSLRLKQLFAVTSVLRIRDELKSDDGEYFQETTRGYDLGREAFNTGVFVFDTDLINNDTFDNLLAVYRKFGKLSIYGEEAVLNLFFYEKWNKLSLIYNTSPYWMRIIYRVGCKKIKAVVVHFFGDIKPWQTHSPYYDEWRRNLDKSEEMDLGNRPAPLRRPGDKEEFEKYLAYLERRYSNRRVLIYLRLYLLLIDEYIGLLGLFIKRVSPKLYQLISLKKNDRQQ